MTDMTDILAPGWLTMTEAKDLTGYSVHHLARLARLGQVKATRLTARGWFFDRDSLLAYKESARMGPKPKAPEV